MIPELGHFSLILALGLSVCLAIIPSLGVYQRRESWMQLAGSLSAGLWVFVALAFGCLAYAFLTNDFSVAYVADNSNSKLPTIYKFGAIWGAHEGSMLLWTLVMCSWTFAVAIFSRKLTLDMRARVLAVMGALAFGFLLFILLTSDPFTRTLPVVPTNGRDLNPLLQDPGLMGHPPMLYMGYVGFSVPFAFAIATLTSGKLDSAWAKWSRPWTLVAWSFLSIGITLGSAWSYYVLGWGGWWFWDAVENASFLPWLVGTALLHSLSATEKRGVFKSWTVLLAIFAFSLSLLGTFLVRSGVLTSVHAFAVDPRRGLFILIFLAIVVGSSLVLYAVKAANIKSQTGFDYNSREGMILINNLLLGVAASAVLLGTLYPLLYEAISGGEKISVGPPYFNTVFVPIALVLFVVMAVSPFSRWRSTPTRRLIDQWKPLVASLVIVAAMVWVFAPTFRIVPVLVVSIALWILLCLARDLWHRVDNKAEKFKALFKQPLSYYGMMIAHFGIAVAFTGVTLTTYFSKQEDVRMTAGDVVDVGGYHFQFNGVKHVAGPNFMADQGEFKVTRNGKLVTMMRPEKRHFLAGGQVQTEAAMDPSFTRDLYVALGDPIDKKTGAWAVRVHYKPFVRWIWGGGFLVALGGFVTVMDRRYRPERRRVPVTSGLVAGAST